MVMKALDETGASRCLSYFFGRGYAIKELFDATVKALGIQLEKDVEVRPRNEDDVYTILLDPSETNKDFGWKITTPLEVGIKAAIEWYKSHGLTETFLRI